MAGTDADSNQVAIAALKAQLSDYLRQVKGGRELIITERGRPIALLRPLTDALEDGTRVEDLVARGAARAPERGADVELWRRSRPADPSGRSLDILLEERADGR